MTVAKKAYLDQLIIVHTFLASNPQELAPMAPKLIWMKITLNYNSNISNNVRAKSRNPSKIRSNAKTLFNKAP